MTCGSMGALLGPNQTPHPRGAPARPPGGSGFPFWPPSPFPSPIPRQLEPGTLLPCGRSYFISAARSIRVPVPTRSPARNVIHRSNKSSSRHQTIADPCRMAAVSVQVRATLTRGKETRTRYQAEPGKHKPTGQAGTGTSPRCAQPPGELRHGTAPKSLLNAGSATASGSEKGPRPKGLSVPLAQRGTPKLGSPLCHPGQGGGRHPPAPSPLLHPQLWGSPTPAP